MAKTRAKHRSRGQQAPAPTEPSRGALASSAIGGGLAGLGVLLIVFVVSRLGSEPVNTEETQPRASRQPHATAAPHTTTQPRQTRPATTEESAAFRQHQDQGAQLLARAEFSEAERAFERAATCPAPAASSHRAREQAKLCQTLATVTRDVKPPAEGQANAFYDIRLKGSGKVLRARVLERKDGTVRYAAKGMQGTLAQAQIESMDPVSAAQLKAETQQRVQELRAQAAAANTALAYYLAGAEALSLGVRLDASDLLQEAYGRAREGGEDLATVVREHKAWGLLKTGMWYYSVNLQPRARTTFNQIISDYQRTRAAKLAREMLGEMEGGQALDVKKLLKRKTPAEQPGAGTHQETRAEPEINVRVADNKQRAEAAAQRGEAALKRGMEVDGARESNRCYREASRLLREAVVRLQHEVEKAPNDRTLERRLQQWMRQLYSAEKLLRLDL